MTNEEKAFELSSASKQDFTIKESNAAYNAALEMAEWKDKEWAERFKKAFEGLWTASFNVDNLSNEIKTTIEFQLVTRK